MRIIYVTASLPHGSTEPFIVPEIRQLSRLGHEILVVPRSLTGCVVHGQDVLKYSRLEGLFSARVLRKVAVISVARPKRMLGAARPLLGGRSVRVALKNLAVLPKAFWLADLATEWKADHIHCHWASTTATMAMIASRLSSIPWSLTTHRWDIVENNLLAAKVSSASFVRFISEDGLRMAREIGLESEHHVRVLHVGVTIPGPARAQTAGSRPVVVCPARLSMVKGHRFLLEAWRILRDRGVEGELWLAGDGELRSRLEGLAKTLDLNGSVRFLGVVPHDKLMKMYEDGAVSAVAMASIEMGNGFHEGIPAGIIEPMSYGVPVVGTSTGGTGELVVPGTGLLVPPEDPVALADAIQRLLQDGAFREQLGRAGRQRVVDTCDIRQIASELANTFEAITTRYRAQASVHSGPDWNTVKTARAEAPRT